ncbi:nucleoside diphosphate kinase 7 [Neocloeon triangulifer]|uniref:nucleoside diphosphate kinase 7 n=1 Tax=Neocloeon triangulifer TaxID=2078957 RepID=UPI00286F13B0|nr:nucleoside diphosphate kinase 7 [Neocloeon triangulifer]
MDCKNLAFEAEWYDEESGLNRTFTMIYFPESNQVQLFEPRTNKMFLKKSSVDGLKPSDIYVGSEVTILARQFWLKAFGDDYTRRVLECKNEQTFAMVHPDCVRKMGTVFAEIQKTNLRIRAATLAKLTEAQALEFYREHTGKPFLPALAQYLTSGPVLALQLQGEGAVRIWRGMIGDTDPAEAQPDTLRARFGTSKTQNGFHGSDTKEDAMREINSFFPENDRTDHRVAPITSAHLKDCTCCIVKPQAFLDGKLGPIIDSIFEAGFNISGLEVIRFNRVKASEFHEVYNGVLYEFADMVAQLQAGPCVALEITWPRTLMPGRDLITQEPMSEGDNSKFKHASQDIVLAFRALVGPFDPELARKLRPNSLRAKFGEDKVRNSVHCTDLPEDGVLEVEYCFQIMRR